MVSLLEWYFFLTGVFIFFHFLTFYNSDKTLRSLSNNQLVLRDFVSAHFDATAEDGKHGYLVILMKDFTVTIYDASK